MLGLREELRDQNFAPTWISRDALQREEILECHQIVEFSSSCVSSEGHHQVRIVGRDVAKHQLRCVAQFQGRVLLHVMASWWHACGTFGVMSGDLARVLEKADNNHT